MRSALIIGVAAAACGKGDAPPPAAPLAASATVPISAPLHGHSGAPADLGRVTLPRAGAGTVIAILTGHVFQTCQGDPCNAAFKFAVGVCRNPGSGTIDKACADGRWYESDLAWAPGSAGTPWVFTAPVAITASFAVDGQADTVIHVLSEAMAQSQLEGELTLVYTPGPPLAVKADGLVQPQGAAAAP